MNVNLECFIQFLKDNGFEADYIDSFGIGRVGYYFDKISIVFENGCVPEAFMIEILPKFSLAYDVKQFPDDCNCNW